MTSDIDIGGVKPLVTRTEIHCGRTGNSRTNAGKPAYKSQEEQYQEIQELRRHLGELREENSSLKTRTRRLEEDLIRRDRQIEQLMDPAKNDEARRKLTDKGASLVSSLKLRVSRLESTLKDKEAELAKLQASAKATALNELKIEAETYYQEVVRLRNQLNVAQQHQQQQQYQQQQHQQQHQHQHQHQHQQYPKVPQQTSPQHTHAQLHLQPPTPPDGRSMNVAHWSNLRSSGQENREGMHGYRDGGDGQEAPTNSLRHALTQMEEENARLGQQVATLASEKAKLTADIERVLGLSDEVKSNYEGLNRAELIREIERRHEEVARLESQHNQLTDALARRNDLAGDGATLLQARVSELQAREVEWERERSSMRELINTLKDDRMFYKETAQKKESELEGLRQEIQNLQQEVISLHDSNRRRNDHATPPSQRSTRGIVRSTVSSASRSGSSSEANTPTRRPRTSSARPPPVATRTQRSSKSSSEPRELPPQSKSRKTPTTQTSQVTKKPVISKTSSRQTSSTSSPSKATASSLQNSISNARPSSGSRRTTVSSTSSSPKASPYSSPKHSSTSRVNSGPASKTPTPLSSPYRSAGSASPQQRTVSRTSPQHKQSGLPSPSKVPTSRTSSKASTSSSPVKSSPSKISSPNRSPSKVPLPKTSSPSKTQIKKREESASPVRSPKTTVKQDIRSESSLYATSRRKAAVESITPGTVATSRWDDSLHPLPAQQQEWRMYHSTKHVVPHLHYTGSCHIQHFHGQEEDEQILAEIIFHRETDSSGEASDPSHGMVRQGTITLSTHEDQAPSQGEEEEESDKTSERADSSSSLIRQNTVTLSKSEDSEIKNSRESSREEVELPKEAEAEPEENEAGQDLKSEDTPEPVVSAQDTEIIENLELLQALLSSHLSRHRKVNELLSQEPLLVGQGQASCESSPSRRRGRSTREAPDGEEASRGSSKRSQSLVRQGTFNVNEQDSAVATIHATLDAHLTRVNKVHEFSTKH